MDFIGALENALGKTAELSMMPMQPGDVKSTYADTRKPEEWVGFNPPTPLKEGVKKFIVGIETFIKFEYL